jgi:hypothetical protein
MTAWDTPPIRFFQSIFLHNIHSKITLPCRNVEVFRRVATFVLALQEAHLNTENFFKTEL